MPRNDPPLSFPVRGVPGGWRDRWDDPDDSAELQAQAVATERRLEAAAARIGRRWQREIARETSAAGSGPLGMSRAPNGAGASLVTMGLALALALW
jgi:hypothetical protein